MGIVLLTFIATGLLVLSVLYFLFKKYDSSIKPFKSAPYWILSFIATILTFIGVVFLLFFTTSSFEAQTFNQEAWTENRDYRYLYADDLIDNRKLIGLSTEEIEKMLGDADYKDDTLLIFNIGYSPEVFMNMDPDWLEIEIANGKAMATSIRE